MKEQILAIIEAALTANAKYSFDTDGQTIWIDSPDGKSTYYVSIEKCEGQDD